MPGKGTADDVKLVLHLGVHRTGSTRLQAILDDHAGDLAEVGVAVMTPPRPGRREAGTIREHVRRARRLGRAGNPLKRLLERMRARPALRAAMGRALDAAAPAERLVISDETLLGPAYWLGRGGLYPEAEQVLSGFRQLLGRAPDEIHVTLRAYDSFIVSVYAMRAVYAGIHPPFDALRPRLLAMVSGWPELIESIAWVFPESRLKITRMEHDAFESRIADLVGEAPAAGMRIDEGTRANVSPTLPAIEEARNLRLSHEEADALIARHAGGRRFDPLSDEEKAVLRQRYEADIAYLRESGRWEVS